MYDGKIETEGNADEFFSAADNPRLEKYLRSYDG
jgi:ABC-type histidine transport system ATPase subunit